MNYIDHSIILPEIRQRISNENPQSKKIEGKYIRGITCPKCGENEAWSYYQKPLFVFCQRMNNCGVNTSIKEMYPDIFKELAEKFPPTEDNPKATAAAYLESRGLDTRKIEFSQGKRKEGGREYPTLKINVDSETVFHRLIDYEGKNRTRIFGAYSGKVWKPDNLDYSQPIWITEGIIDALSLIQSGEQSAATLSSKHLPKKFYEKLSASNTEIILAFDNDKAGKEAIDKHCHFFDEHNKNSEIQIKYKVAFPPEGKDWNDLLISGALNEDRREQTIKDCLWRGRLYKAKSDNQYYEIYCEKRGDKPAVFEYHNQMFKGCSKEVGKEKEIEYYTKRLADCSINVLYSIQDDSREYRTKTKLRLALRSYKEGKNIVECSAEELSKINDFKILLANQRQVFFGNSYELLELTKHLFNKSAPKIRQCNTLGYDKKSGCFVFPAFLYDRQGKRQTANKDKYFEKQSLAPATFRDALIETYKKVEIKSFLKTLFDAYSYRGLLSLGFWTATAFSHVIFEKFVFFPFLSMYGDPHCGKSYLTKLLNHCFFIDWEGLPMTEINTKKGEIRKIVQKSSLVTPLLEAGKNSRFDFYSILPLYNRNPPQTRANKSSGIDTNEIDFEGSLAFVQNNELFPSKAAKERVVSIRFKESELNKETKIAWEKLNSYSNEELAYVGHAIFSTRNWFEERMVERIKDISESLEKEHDIKVDRIADNHAIALAAIDLVMEKFDFQAQEVKDGLAGFVVEMAKTKMETAKNEAPLADLFFDCLQKLPEPTLEELGNDCYRVNEDGHILVSLDMALEATKQHWNKTELMNDLKLSEYYIINKYKKGTKKLFGKEIRCWKFKNFLK